MSQQKWLVGLNDSEHEDGTEILSRNLNFLELDVMLLVELYN